MKKLFYIILTLAAPLYAMDKQILYLSKGMQQCDDTQIPPKKVNNFLVPPPIDKKLFSKGSQNVEKIPSLSLELFSQQDYKSDQENVTVTTHQHKDEPLLIITFLQELNREKPITIHLEKPLGTPWIPQLKLSSIENNEQHPFAVRGQVWIDSQKDRQRTDTDDALISPMHSQKHQTCSTVVLIAPNNSVRTSQRSFISARSQSEQKVLTETGNTQKKYLVTNRKTAESTDPTRSFSKERKKDFTKLIKKVKSSSCSCSCIIL